MSTNEQNVQVAKKLRNRTISVRVAEVVDGGTKEEFYADLRASLDLARRAANRMVTECIRLDTELMTGGKCNFAYRNFGKHLYEAANKEFPGVTSVASSLMKSVETKYKQERFHVATGRKSICHYRSQPWPVLKSTGLKVTDNGQFITVRMKLLGGFWVVRLAGGSNYRDQIKGIREAIERGSICDSKIHIDRRHVAVLLLSVSLPPVEAEAAQGVLNVSTAIDALIVATKSRSETPYVITGDQVKKWQKERRRRHQRLRQDKKDRKSRKAVNGLLDRSSEKYQRRLNSYTHYVAATIVSYAKRRNVSTIKYDATVKSYIKSFPYHELMAKIQYKCQDAGIEFIDASQTISEPSVNKPHVYMAYSPVRGEVKIGCTSKEDLSRIKSGKTWCPDAVYLAIDVQPYGRLRAREKHYHSLFADHRLYKGPGNEWFAAEPVIHFLRERGWLGNAGNLSQIAQVIPVEVVPQGDPPQGSSAKPNSCLQSVGCSQDAYNSTGYPALQPGAP